MSATKEATPKGNGPYKFQVQLNEEGLQRLEALQKSRGAKTKAEIIRESLKYYEWLDGLASQNRILEIQSEDEKPIYRIPIDTFLK